METETLCYINQVLTEIGINYSFSRWNGEVAFPYWVGEYSDNESDYEDHSTDAEFILTGTTENSWLSLQDDRTKIVTIFRNHKTILSNGIGLCIDVLNSLIVPTETEELKRIQITLSVKEWRNY